MNFFSFLLMLAIAALTGSIGASLAGRKRTGCLASIALGFIGAIIGTFIAQKFDLPQIWTIRLGDYNFPVIWAVAGSALFVAFLNIFSSK